MIKDWWKNNKRISTTREKHWLYIYIYGIIYRYGCNDDNRLMDNRLFQNRQWVVSGCFRLFKAENFHAANYLLSWDAVAVASQHFKVQDVLQERFYPESSTGFPFRSKEMFQKKTRRCDAIWSICRWLRLQSRCSHSVHHPHSPVARDVLVVKLQNQSNPQENMGDLDGFSI